MLSAKTPANCTSAAPSSARREALNISMPITTPMKIPGAKPTRRENTTPRIANSTIDGWIVTTEVTFQPRSTISPVSQLTP